MEHLHTVFDDDLYFSIDPTSRTIEYQGEGNPVLAQKDHNSEQFTFEMPRYVDGHDMLLCDVVQVHYINIDGESKSKRNTGMYVVKDLVVNPDDEESVVCTWLISQNATMYAGSLSFVLRFVCTSGGSIVYSWNTTAYNNVSVVTSIDNAEAIVEQYSDVLNDWYRELIISGTMGINAILAAKDDALQSFSTEAKDITDAAAVELEQSLNDVKPSIIDAAKTEALEAVEEEVAKFMETDVAQLRGLLGYTNETWMFTLEDGTVIAKHVLAKNVEGEIRLRITFAYNDETPDAVMYDGSTFEGITWSQWCADQNYKHTEQTGESYALWENRDGYVYNTVHCCNVIDSNGNKVLWTDKIIAGNYDNCEVLVVVNFYRGELHDPVIFSMRVVPGTTWGDWCEKENNTISFPDGKLWINDYGFVYSFINSVYVADENGVLVRWSDTMVSGNYKDGGTPTAISFTFRGTRYSAYEGSTWDDFTQKHPDVFYTMSDPYNDSGTVWAKLLNTGDITAYGVKDLNDNAVKYTDVIIPKASYGIFD